MWTAQTRPRLGSSYEPLYLLGDIARYASIHPSTARSWVRLIPGRSAPYAPPTGLSFLDLVSILVIRELRDIGVKPRRIRIAEKYLTERLGPYPFAHNTIWSDGHHVLFDPESPLRTEVPQEYLESADKRGQGAFVSLLREDLHRVIYNEQGIAVAWEPMGAVELDPSLQFGQPRVKGTRVLTQTVQRMHMAGDSIETISLVLRLPQRDVHEAIEWERRLLARAA